MTSSRAAAAWFTSARQKHRVARHAFELASKLDGPDGPAKFYATAALGAGQGTTKIDGEAHFGQKLAAMRAHATQITVSAPFYALSDGVRRRAAGTEYYTLLAGPRGPAESETDLFADLGCPAEPRGT